MDLLAVKECTDARFLPARYRQASLADVNGRIAPVGDDGRRLDRLAPEHQPIVRKDVDPNALGEHERLLELVLLGGQPEVDLVPCLVVLRQQRRELTAQRAHRGEARGEGLDDRCEVVRQRAGLAVVDWPNSFGYSMFLYPLSRMTGGIYYEHAHRLFGALLGLTTLAVAIRLWRVETRSWVRILAAVAVAAVVIQGLLGGLRVTGRLTFSTAPEDMAPSIGLAILHGVFGQLFLALMVVLAAANSRRWRTAPERQPELRAATDRTLQTVLVGALVVQLLLGAIQRHLAQGLVVHISLATIVTILVIAAGARAWGLFHGVWPMQRLGQLLMSLVGIQVALGIAALAVTQGRAIVGHPTTIEVTIATAHQAAGAALLALAVLLAAWTRRLYQPA